MKENVWDRTYHYKQIRLPVFYVEKLSLKDVQEGVQSNNAPRRIEGQDHDTLAYKYRDALVFVWAGDMKGRLGRVKSIGGIYAQVEFTGTAYGSGVRHLKRRNLIRCVNKSAQ